MADFGTDPRPLGNHLLVREVAEQQGRFQTQVVFPTMKMEDGKVEVGGAQEIAEPQMPLPARGIVTAVGPGYAVEVEGEQFKFVAMQVKPGDEILFYSQGAIQLRVPTGDPDAPEGELLLLISEAQVLVILSSVSVAF